MKAVAREPITLKELWLSLTVAAVCFALYHVSPIPTGVVIPFLVLGGIGRYVSRLRAGWLCGTFFGAFACFLATILGVAALFALHICSRCRRLRNALARSSPMRSSFSGFQRNYHQASNTVLRPQFLQDPSQMARARMSPMLHSRMVGADRPRTLQASMKTGA